MDTETTAIPNFKYTILLPPFELLLIFKRKTSFEYLNSHKVNETLSFCGGKMKKSFNTWGYFSDLVDVVCGIFIHGVPHLCWAL